MGNSRGLPVNEEPTRKAPQFFLFFFKKGIAFPGHLCYNKTIERGQEPYEGGTPMKFRVVHPNYFPTYFKTKKAAKLFQEQIGGKIQRKIACDWYDC